VVLEEYVPSRSLLDAPEHQAEAVEVHTLVSQAIAELPELYRSVVLLRHVEDLSYEEIAGALDLPVGTIKVRLHRGRAMLQEKLHAAGPQAQVEEIARPLDTTVTT
jgi:RNA polymerase sigma-70 factor, ECF subfamily